MLKEIDGTHSQVRKILAPYDGEFVDKELVINACKGLTFDTKYQAASFEDFIKDAAAYGDAVLAICLAADDKRSAINEYLAVNQCNHTGSRYSKGLSGKAWWYFLCTKCCRFTSAGTANRNKKMCGVTGGICALSSDRNRGTAQLPIGKGISIARMLEPTDLCR